jgi:hypothetical protein
MEYAGEERQYSTKQVFDKGLRHGSEETDKNEADKNTNVWGVCVWG